MMLQQERKMEMRKAFSLALVLALSLVVGIAAAVSAAEKDAEERVIRVATPGSYPPFTMYDEATQEWSGFDIELWRMIGERSGYKIEFLRFEIPASFAELDLERADTVAQQVSITPARQAKYNFTQPYFFSPYCLTVAESNNEVKSWKDMEGKSIALPQGGSEIEFITALDPENKVKKSIYESGMLHEVSLGRITAFNYSALTLPYRLKQSPGLKLKSVDVENPVFVEVNAYPFARTERGRKLLELTDGILTRMIEDGSYADFCKKWFGTDVMESKYAKEYREKKKK